MERQVRCGTADERGVAGARTHKALIEWVDRDVVTCLEEPIGWEGGSWAPAAGIGTSRPRAGDDLTLVIRDADREMSVAKRQRTPRALCGSVEGMPA